MRLLILLIGLFLPLSVDAAKLEKVGGYSGAIWTQACTVLPYCGMGGSGVLIVTRMLTGAVLWTIGAGAVVIILYAAVRIVSSAGNEEVLGKARKVIFYAALGLLFAVLAGTIVNYVFALVAGIAGAA